LTHSKVGPARSLTPRLKKPVNYVRYCPPKKTPEPPLLSLRHRIGPRTEFYPWRPPKFAHDTPSYRAVGRPVFLPENLSAVIKRALESIRKNPIVTSGSRTCLRQGCGSHPLEESWNLQRNFQNGAVLETHQPSRRMLKLFADF